MKKDDVVVIDIREANELKETGKITGSVHAPRGMLEFYADPSLPYYKPEFEADRNNHPALCSRWQVCFSHSDLKTNGLYQCSSHVWWLKAWKENNLPHK